MVDANMVLWGLLVKLQTTYPYHQSSSIFLMDSEDNDSYCILFDICIVISMQKYGATRKPSQQKSAISYNFLVSNFYGNGLISETHK